MTLVSPDQSAPLEEINASDINNPVNQIAAVVNGNLDDTNISSLSGTKISSGTIPSAAMATAANPETRFSETGFDFVASGCVWSGDSYGSTRAASMTSGVVYIGGKRVTVSAVTARSFTASKDTYIDVDNTGTLTYTEVANNAASPTLAASSIRLGIIVTGASNIANVGSVNQGQQDKVLPIASSVAYSVTDSLGNLICPRDPSRKLLGYKQIIANISSAATSSTLMTGLSCPVIAPVGRKVVVSFGADGVFNSGSANNFFIEVWDGTVGSGTRLQQMSLTAPGANYIMNGNMSAPPTVITTASKTFNMGYYSSAGTTNIRSTGATSPAWIKVELV